MITFAVHWAIACFSSARVAGTKRQAGALMATSAVEEDTTTIRDSQRNAQGVSGTPIALWIMSVQGGKFRRITEDSASSSRGLLRRAETRAPALIEGDAGQSSTGRFRARSGARPRLACGLLRTDVRGRDAGLRQLEWDPEVQEARRLLDSGSVRMITEDLTRSRSYSLDSTWRHAADRRHRAERHGAVEQPPG